MIFYPIRSATQGLLHGIVGRQIKDLYYSGLSRNEKMKTDWFLFLQCTGNINNMAFFYEIILLNCCSQYKKAWKQVIFSIHIIEKNTFWGLCSISLGYREPYFGVVLLIKRGTRAPQIDLMYTSKRHHLNCWSDSIFCMF